MHVVLHKKRSFPLRIPSVNETKSWESADLITFTEKRFNGKFHLSCSVDVCI